MAAYAQSLPFSDTVALPESRRYGCGVTTYLFTVVCDFNGGTYVQQVSAKDEHHALAAWADAIRRDRPMGSVAELIADKVSIDCQPTALDGLSGVWCWTSTVNGQLTLANIVRCS